MVLGRFLESVSRLGRGMLSSIGVSSRESVNSWISELESLLVMIEDYKKCLHSRSRRKYNRTLNIKFSEEDLIRVLRSRILPSSFRVEGIRFNRSYEPSPLFVYLGISKPISINKFNNVLLKKLDSM